MRRQCTVRSLDSGNGREPMAAHVPATAGNSVFGGASSSRFCSGALQTSVGHTCLCILGALFGAAAVLCAAAWDASGLWQGWCAVMPGQLCCCHEKKLEMRLLVGFSLFVGSVPPARSLLFSLPLFPFPHLHGLETHVAVRGREPSS